MAPLTAAQVENAVVALEPDAADQQVDFIGRIAIVLDYIAVGFEVERVEQSAPPVGRQVTFEIRDRTQCSRADAPVRLGMVEIRAGRAGVGQVSLGGGPRTVGFLPHIDLPRLSGNQKSGFPLRGTAEQECLVGWHQQHRSRPLARSGVGIRWSEERGKGLRERSCRPAAARSAWSLKKSFSGLANSASRREVRNKCLSFQGGIFCAAELSGRAAIRPMWDITAASDPRPRPNRASRNWMQFDRSEANALRQVDDDELPLRRRATPARGSADPARPSSPRCGRRAECRSAGQRTHEQPWRRVRRAIPCRQ